MRPTGKGHGNHGYKREVPAQAGGQEGFLEEATLGLKDERKLPEQRGAGENPF